MKPSERIEQLFAEHAAKRREGSAPADAEYVNCIVRALVGYLDELDEQRKGAPELWAVIRSDGRIVALCMTREEANENLRGVQKYPSLRGGYGNREMVDPDPGARLARFVGEWVDG